MIEFLSQLDLYFRIACAALVIVGLCLIGGRKTFLVIVFACLLGLALILGVSR